MVVEAFAPLPRLKRHLFKADSTEARVGPHRNGSSRRGGWTTNVASSRHFAVSPSPTWCSAYRIPIVLIAWNLIVGQAFSQAEACPTNNHQNIRRSTLDRAGYPAALRHEPIIDPTRWFFAPQGPKYDSIEGIESSPGRYFSG